MFERIRAQATAAAEKGARDEVRKVMTALLEPVVKKAMTNGVEVSVEGPGGIVLGSICLRIPDVTDGLSVADVADLRELVEVLAGDPDSDGRQSAFDAIAEILNPTPMGPLMQMDLDTGEIKPIK